MMFSNTPADAGWPITAWYGRAFDAISRRRFAEGGTRARSAGGVEMARVVDVRTPEILD
jgi:hypothetical protein